MKKLILSLDPDAHFGIRFRGSGDGEWDLVRLAEVPDAERDG
jgi:hypothetical protein